MKRNNFPQSKFLVWIYCTWKLNYTQTIRELLLTLCVCGKKKKYCNMKLYGQKTCILCYYYSQVFKGKEKMSSGKKSEEGALDLCLIFQRRNYSLLAHVFPDMFACVTVLPFKRTLPHCYWTKRCQTEVISELQRGFFLPPGSKHACLTCNWRGSSNKVNALLL